jgi:hypothetical protein
MASVAAKKKWRRLAKASWPGAHHAGIDLVDQGGGLECVVTAFVGHACGGDLSEAAGTPAAGSRRRPSHRPLPPVEAAWSGVGRGRRATAWNLSGASTYQSPDMPLKAQGQVGVGSTESTEMDAVL